MHTSQLGNAPKLGGRRISGGATGVRFFTLACIQYTGVSIMSNSHWLLWLGVAMVGLQLYWAYQLYRHGKRETLLSDPGDQSNMSNFSTTDGNSVTCPHCRTENDRGYRFCRECVGELPGGMAIQETADRPLGRIIR